MKKVTKVEWVIVAEDGLPEEITSNDFMLKIEDEKEIMYHAHFAHDLKDIYNILKDIEVWQIEKIHLPCSLQMKEQAELFKTGFFFAIEDNKYVFDGEEEKFMYILNPKRIIAWAEIVM